jgi:high-affinity nickel-transport protein
VPAGAATPAAPLSRALLVGGVHGMEGSGAVVLVALPALHGSAHAFAYLGVFGVGSILGMLICSLAVSLPMDAAAQRFAGAGRALQLAVGATSVFIGGSIAGRALYPYIRSIFT